MLPCLAHAVAFNHHHYIPTDPVQRCILPTPFLTFTSCMSTVSCKLSMRFLTCVILALTAALFLTNALRVWESMVLKIGKQSKLTDLCAAMIQGSVYVRWQLCCSVAVYRSAYAVACCYAVLRSSCLKLFCLRFLIESMLTHNPA